MKKKNFKKYVLGASTLAITLSSVSMTPVMAATSSNSIETTDINSIKSEDLISIIDPYVVETVSSYKLVNENELATIIGQDKVDSLKLYLKEASKEKAKSLNREAVRETHIRILEMAGCNVSAHWWGKKVVLAKTNNTAYAKSRAKNVRDLTEAFSGAAGDAGMTTALAAAGLSFIPGLGTASSIAGLLVGGIAWADARTWSTVSSGVKKKIDVGKYFMTIDINKWIMEVKVY